MKETQGREEARETRQKLRRKIGKIEEIEVEGKTRWRGEK